MSRSPQPGDLLGDRYRVIDVVGSGGMGIVYRAQNVVTNKFVALKWLRPRFASGAGAERLLREARATSLLKHPHIVDIYDLTQDTASDTWVLVMELLQGETLREYILRSRQVKLSSFIALLSPAMGAVVAAHALGIVHRDLKPENIFLERVPSLDRIIPKVLDFGIAKLNGPGEGAITATGTTLGTPYYMSPEQYLGEKDIDARTDIYAFGAMLYEAITGRMPHTASSLPELALKVTTCDAAPIKTLCPEVPSSLARLVDWSLARRRDDRIPTLEQLRDELEVFTSEQRFRGELSVSSASTPLIAAPAIIGETSAESQLGVRLEPADDAGETPAHVLEMYGPQRAHPSRRARSHWIPWSLLALTLAMWAVLSAPKIRLAGAGVHAIDRPSQSVPPASESVAIAPDVSESSSSKTLTSAATTACVTTDAVAVPPQPFEREPLARAAATPATPPPTAALERGSVQRSRAKSKGRTHELVLSTPSASSTSAAEDPERSIPRILAF